LVRPCPLLSSVFRDEAHDDPTEIPDVEIHPRAIANVSNSAFAIAAV
jgi:hypothetical protein